VAGWSAGCRCRCCWRPSREGDPVIKGELGLPAGWALLLVGSLGCKAGERGAVGLLCWGSAAGLERGLGAKALLGEAVAWAAGGSRLSLGLGKMGAASWGVGG